MRYEDVIASGGAALAAVVPNAAALVEPLVSRNPPTATGSGSDGLDRLAELLLSSDSPCWHFYRREEALAIGLPAARRAPS